MNKKVKWMQFFIAILVFGSLTACSNQLTEDKVKNIVLDCLEREAQYEEASLTTGKVLRLGAHYKELEAQGLVTIEEKAKSATGKGKKYYLVGLTDKAKPYVLDSETKTNKIKNTIRLSTYKFSAVGDIKQYKTKPKAKAKITMDKVDKTPFYDALSKDKANFKVKDITIYNRKYKGWVLCD